MAAFDGAGAQMGETKRFEALDGLRGVAALLVVLTHATYRATGQHLIAHGYLAVDFFFALSGFVIAHAYAERLERGMSLREFALRRIMRLHPLVALGTILGLIACTVTTSAPAWQLALAAAAGLFTLPTVGLHAVGNGMWPINPPTWSLFWEYAANLAFALGVYRWRTSRLVWVAAAGFLGLCAAAVIYGSIEVGWARQHAWGGPARVAFAFTLGMILYRLRPRLPRVTVPTSILALIVGACLTIPTPGLDGAFDLFCVSIVVPAVLVLATNQKDGSATWAWSGRLSYPLYILHLPVLLLVLSLPGSAWFHILAGAVASLIASAAALICYDEPLRAWLSRARASRPVLVEV